MKTISILGSTGSIGTQALEVAEKHNFKIKKLLIIFLINGFKLETNGELCFSFF